MEYEVNIRNFLIVMSFLVFGTICFTKVGTIDLHAVWAASKVVIPAAIVLGFLGAKIGEIVDNPKNRADADYKLAVLNALKKMDKSITLQELNEKLTKTVKEPDAPEIEPEEDDLDV